MNSEKNYKRLLLLDKLFKNQKKLLIVLHNYPDPDAIASAYALSYIARYQYTVKSSIAHSGYVGRAENRAMINELKIKLKNINRVRINSYDCFALIDTQPGAGNNSIPSKIICDLVIDHHPRRKNIKCKNILIDPEVGASATVLVELLKDTNLSIPANLATALTYAIRSETQDLGRGTTERDINAYFYVYPKSNISKMAKIMHPKLPRSYFKVLVNTIRCTLRFRHLICSHLDKVESPEIVAEMADLLLRHKHISWSLCTGIFNEELFLSMRSSNPKAKAGILIQRLIKNRYNAGGHGMFAGGKITIKGLDKNEILELEKKLSENFAKLLGYRNVKWNPIIEE